MAPRTGVERRREESDAPGVGRPIDVSRRPRSSVAASEAGYALTELLVVLVILGVVVASLGTLFTSGTNAERDLNARFQAQSAARTALDRLRSEIHTSCEAFVTGGNRLLLMRLDASSACSVSNATWCTSGSGSRFGLYRGAGASCSSTSGVRFADHLTSDTVFSVVTSAGRLPRVGVDLRVNPRTDAPRLEYRLQDAIVLRNGRRS